METPLWQPRPEAVRRTQMHRFMVAVNERFGKEFTDYDDLYRWSVDSISDFWAALWDFLEIRASAPWTRVIDDPKKMPGARWFEGARLNFAENLLRYTDERTAIVFKGEGRPVARMTYAELYREVAAISAALERMGIGPGDRVVGFMPNVPQTVCAMLAAVSLGATWSSCSPDFGVKGVLDRFGQIRPRVIFAADGYRFKGRRIDSIERLAGILKELPSIERVVVVPYTREDADITALPNAVHYRDFVAADPPATIPFAQLPFEHPLYIMYSSGTTGLPKCMVQSAGGILLHQMKELVLHTDLRRQDVIFYFTTCGWMMWNWLTCALSTGATLVLFDGNPFHPGPEALWELAEEAGITVFGTSAGYLGALEASGLKPGESFDLAPLRAVLSTGSPLSQEGFEFVYRDIKSDLQLASISGGTDLNGCFALGNPMAPVYPGELQCRGLGMKVEAFDPEGRSVVGEKGELVCTAPFPSMPIHFWNDPDGEKYRSAYFDVYPGVWRHGDYIRITGRGGVVIYGRSDATLNPGGVRIGTAEIYRQIDPIEEVADCVVVGQRWKGDVRVVLFVQMAPGFELTAELENRIRRAIRENASPRHVPAKIVAVPDIPYTLNMKKVELAVRNVIHGEPVKNKDALRNPEALDFYAEIPALSSD
jgi:acetoacetyl-CoA synthetase